MAPKRERGEYLPLCIREVLDSRNTWPKIYTQRHHVIREMLGKKKVAPPDVLPELAELVQYVVKIITLNENNVLYYFDPDKGSWEKGAKNIIRQITRYTIDNISIRSLNEVIDIIRTSTYDTIDLFNQKEVLVMKNKTLDLNTYEIKKHSPDYYMTRALPVVYNPEQDCPNIKKFLSQVTSEESIRILEEAIGYCLWPEYPYKRAFVLLGPTHTGKSTFLNLLSAFLGRKNCSYLTMNQMTKRQFGLYTLQGKFANISPDMPEKAVYSTGLFKALTGDDSIKADVKFKESIEFNNIAKLFFQANSLPPSLYDDTDAYYGRWIIIDFPNQFLNNADPDLIHKLTTPEELSGLLNLALSGLQRLRIRGRFEETIDLQAKKDAYLILSDTVKAFVHMKCEIRSDQWIYKQELYSNYCDFCFINKHSPVPYNQFTRKLKTWVPDLNTAKITERGKQVPIYRGIGLPGGHFKQEQL